MDYKDARVLAPGLSLGKRLQGSQSIFYIPHISFSSILGDIAFRVA